MTCYDNGTMSKQPATSKPRIGRPPIAVDQRCVVSSIRLTPARWEKFYALGGVQWLIDRIDRARKMPAGD